MSLALDIEGMLLLLLLLLDQQLTQPHLLVMYLSFLIGKLALRGLYLVLKLLPILFLYIVVPVDKLLKPLLVLVNL